MADRSITNKLNADISNFEANMKRAGKISEEFGRKTEQATDKASQATLTLSQKIEANSTHLSTVANGFIAVGGLGVAAIGGMTKTASDFEKQMSAVQAATLASADEMETLREAALEAGAATAFSATEAAQGIEELAKAGVETADILNGGLKGALDLAAAGDIEVAEAAEIAASAMVQFNLAGSDVSHVADLLAAGASKAQGGVSDLGQALNQVGVVASSAGLSVEDVVGTLSAFASAGLMGSDAGTSFKSMLQRLQNPSTKARKVMDELGISLYDSSGHIITMSELAGQLQDSLGGLTDAERDAAMALIFGSDAIRSANILYQQGADGIAGWVEAVNESGYASQVAETRMDNLAGSWEEFTGSLETLAISVGSMLLPALKSITDVGTTVVNFFNDLPGPVKAVATGIGGLVSVGLLFTGIGMKLAPVVTTMVGAFRSLASAGIPMISTAMAGLSTAAGAVPGIMARFAASLSLAGPIYLAVGAIAGLIAAIASIGDTSYDTKLSVEGLAGTFDSVSGAATQATRDMIAQDLATSGLIEAYEAAGGAASDLTDAVMGDADAMARVRDIWGETTEEVVTYTDGMGMVVDSETKTIEVHEAEMDALRGLQGTYSETKQRMEEASRASNGVADSTGEVAEAAEEAAEAMDELLDAIRDYADINIDADKAALKYAEALRGVGDVLEDDSYKTADAETQMLYLKDAMGTLADSGHTLIEAMAEQGASSSELGRRSVELAKDFVAQAEALGITGDAAVDLASDYGMIPEEINTVADFDTWKAEQDADGYENTLESISPTTETTANYDTWTATAKAALYQRNLDSTPKTTNTKATFSSSVAEGALSSWRNKLDSIPTHKTTVVSVIQQGIASALFASGGYTGDGGKYEPAGVVHRGEFVFTKEATAALTPQFLYGLMASAHRGYADGGYVAPASATLRPRIVVEQPTLAGQRLVLEVDGRTMTGYVRDIATDVAIDVANSR